jgi:hypothetical protein
MALVLAMMYKRNGLRECDRLHESVTGCVSECDRLRA